MKKLFVCLFLGITLAFCGCGSETSMEEINELYYDISILVDELGETTAITEKDVYKEIREESKEALTNVENIKGHDEIKSKLEEICKNINESCKYGYETDINISKDEWDKSTEYYNKAYDTLEEVENMLD